MSEEEQPLFVDLAPYLTGEVIRELPTVGPVQGGGALLYRGRLNEIHGEPEAGKTNIALAIAGEVIKRSGTVVFLDPEDSPFPIVNRLRAFGNDPDRILKYFRYCHNPEPREIQRAIEWSRGNEVELVVVDGLAELLTSTGLSENDPGDILRFFREACRPFAEECGAAVLISDHVTKSSDDRGRWARGSGAKLGRYDGAVYEVKVIKPYGPDAPGKVKLVVCKDRCGGVGVRGSSPAEICFDPVDGQTRVTIRETEDPEWRPHALMEKVSRAIEADPSISYRQLRQLGRSKYIDAAIEMLRDIGHLVVEKPGIGMANRYSIIIPYRQQ